MAVVSLIMININFFVRHNIRNFSKLASGLFGLAMASTAVQIIGLIILCVLAIKSTKVIVVRVTEKKDIQELESSSVPEAHWRETNEPPPLTIDDIEARFVRRVVERSGIDFDEIPDAPPEPPVQPVVETGLAATMSSIFRSLFSDKQDSSQPKKEETLGELLDKLPDDPDAVKRQKQPEVSESDDGDAPKPAVPDAAPPLPALVPATTAPATTAPTTAPQT
jgi:hypothetical protein